MTLGEKIRDNRKRLHLSQRELGEILGVQDSAVSKWEHGRVDNLTILQIRQLAEIFDVSPVWLAGWSDDPKRGEHQLY